MTQTINTAEKRLRIGRILLLLVLIIALLVAGFVLRSFVPTGWLQSLRIGSAELPAWLVQAPEVSPTALAGVVTGDMSTNTPTARLVTPLPSSSPTATSTTIAVEAGPGVVTVLTLTPTSEVRATETIPTAAETMSPTRTSFPDMATTKGPAVLNEQLRGIPDELRSLNRLLSVSRILLLTIGEGQPVEEERALLDAQLRVVALRMETLEARLSEGEAATDVFGTVGTISSEQAAELLATMREAVGLLRGELADPEADGASLLQIEAQLGLIQEIMQQLRVMVSPAQDGSTPQLSPTPAPTNRPTSLPTPTIQTDASVDQMLAMMEEMLRQMREMMPSTGSNP